MQNFTLGKKGISMLFLTFILLIGSLPSFGQENCPIVADTTQDFCYLETVAELEATANGDTVRWYRTATATNPIPENELLETGTYYAGNESGTCNNRIAVSVTVDDYGSPTTQFGVIFQPCEYDEDDSSTVADLIELIEGNEVEIYDQEYAGEPLTENTILIDGNSYFAGQRNPETDCPTSRLALRYDPILAEAPTAEPLQVFCPEATVADLEAQATHPDTQAFRWYSTATSQPALSSTTPLIDGETYYASQIINRSNSTQPPCESVDRAPVLVEILPAPFSGNLVYEFCVTEAQAIVQEPEDAVEYIIALLVNEGVEVDLAQFEEGAEAELDRLYNFIQNPDTESETFNFIYNNPSENPDCEDGQIIIEVTINDVEEVSAGEIDNDVVCSSDGLIDLNTYLEGSGATPGGTFSGEGVENNMFDPSLGANEDGYTITYTATGTTDCNTGEDSTTFVITVEDAPFSGNIPLTFCVTEAQEIVEEPEDAFAYISSVLTDLGVEVDPSQFAEGDEEEVFRLYEYIQDPDTPSETFNFTYNNVVESDVCENGVITIEVTINDLEEVSAGDFENPIVCSSDGMINLNNYIEDAGATSGGTFSGEGVQNNMFDSSLGANEDGYIITYTVSGTTDCTTGEDSSTFTITVEDAPLSTALDLNFCITEAQEIVQNPEDAEAYIAELLEDLGVDVDLNNFSDGDAEEVGRLYNYIQNPDSDSETFNFTYNNIVDSDVCEDGVITIAITINNGEPVNAGEFENQIVCSSEGMIDLNTYLDEAGATAGGTFSGEGVENNMFNAAMGANENGYVITYTVTGDGECTTGEESSQFTITVEDAPLSTALNLSFCVTEAQEIVEEPADAEAYIAGLLEELGVDVDLNNFSEGDAEEVGRLYNYIQNPDSDSETFNFTYNNIVDSDVCEDGVITIAVTINNEVEVTAGDFDNQIVCSSEGMIDLNTYLDGSGATAGGTFSGQGVEDNMFNAAMGANEDGYVITYTVTGDGECTTGEDSSQFTITVEDAPFSGNIALAFCVNEAQELIQDPTDLADYLTEVLEGENVVVDPANFGEGAEAELGRLYNFIQNPDSDSETFNFTYNNIVDSDVCEDGVITIAVTINNEVEVTAGGFDNQIVCSSEGMIDLNTYLDGSGATAGGTFSGQGVEDNMFNAAMGANEDGYVITYTVTGDGECTTGEDSSQFTIIVEDAPFSGNIALAFCVNEAQELIQDPTDLTEYLTEVLEGEDVEVDLGNFSEGAEAELGRLFNYIQNPDSDSETFNFTYNNIVDSDVCEDGVITIAVTINSEVPAEVDEIADFEVCTSETQLNLFNELGLSGGVFSNESGEIADGLIDISTAGELPAITYTISEEDNDCFTGSASTTFTITVVEGPFIGEPVTVELCNTEVEPLFGSSPEQEVRNYYLSLLDENVDRENGTFSPSIAEIINSYNDDNFQDFTTTYTLTDGDCVSSVELTVTVLEPQTANVETINDFTVCVSEETLNLYSELNLTVGTFSTNSGVITDGLLDISTTGTLPVITYTVDSESEGCFTGTASTTFTVIVDDSTEAPTAEAEQEFCTEDNPTVADLEIEGDNYRIYTDEELTTEADSTDPLVDGAVYYAAALCGTDSTMITVSVRDTAEAPVADAEQSFCIVDNPTVADLEAEGEGLIWYSDAELTTEAPASTELTNNAVFYVVSSTGDSACETSDAVMVTVTLNSEDSPTIQPEGNEFCRQDNPTVQDLIDNLDGNDIRIYTSSTGGTALAATDELEDNVTYYATATNATTGCESSERRAVDVEVGFCGIPEGFSPNDDGTNDRFVIPDIAEDYPNYTIEIFNRWGNVVFKGNATTPDWDGVSNQSGSLGDNVLPAGVYFYIVNYNDGSTPPVQGKLYLSR